MNDNSYDDIINLPRPVSPSHRPMPRESRAAQFAPFAALTGYDASVREEARLTDNKIVLTEEQEAVLNAKMSRLSEMTTDHPRVTVTYFLADEKKSGGSYVSHEGALNYIDEPNGFLIISGERSEKTRIPLTDIINVEGDALSGTVFDIF